MGGLAASNTMSCRNLSLHQYSQWQEWTQGEGWRRSRQDLMEDIVDSAAERHMYIPAKQAALPCANAAPSCLDNDELVGWIVAQFQNLHTNVLLRQLQLAEGFHELPFSSSPLPPPPRRQCQLYACARSNIYDSITSTTAAEDVSLTELGLTRSMIAEQEELWNRAKQQQAAEPFIPDWLHAAARQEGRRIRVVTVDNSTETKTVTCVGCQQTMLAACNVQIVFCPQCGCTFAPDMI